MKFTSQITGISTLKGRCFLSYCTIWAALKLILWSSCCFRMSVIKGRLRTFFIEDLQPLVPLGDLNFFIALTSFTNKLLLFCGVMLSLNC